MFDAPAARRTPRLQPYVELLEQRALLSGSTAAATAAGLLRAAPPVTADAVRSASGSSRTAHPAVSRATRARTPAAPTNLVATAQTGVRTILAWADNATTETSYSVERNSGRRGRWMAIATLGANVTTYLDRHGAAAGTYSYRVQALNGAYASAYSNVATSVAATSSPTPTPTPTPTASYSGPIVITRGGTYTGNWQSLDPNTPAVQIETDQPVVIANSNIRSAGTVIQAYGNSENVTVTNTTGYGLNPGVYGYHVGRFLDVDGWASVKVNNCTLNNTSGIYLYDYTGDFTANDTVKVIGNVCNNVDGRQSDGHGGWLAVPADPDNYRQFFQINKINGLAGAEVAWNQVVNTSGQSRVEESINISTSSGTRKSPFLIHDNYIQGAFPANAADAVGYTGGGIMVSDNGSAYIQAYNNEIIGTGGIGMEISSGHDNAIFNNRVIASGETSNGTPITFSNVGIVIWNFNSETTFTNNTGTGNVVGWVNGSGERNDVWVPDASKWTGNTSLPGSVTPSTETAEFSMWQAKLAQNGIAIGAK